MPATAVTNNPPAQTESKSAKKKRAKAEASTNGDAAGSAPSNPETPATPATEQPATNGVIVSEAENTFLRDLQKYASLYGFHICLYIFMFWTMN